MVLARVHEDDRPRIRALRDRLIHDLEPYDLEYRIRRPGGEIRIVHGHGEVLCDEHGRPARALGVDEDVTERREAERALAESQTRLRQAERLESVGRLAAGVAHDFNNLLTVILNATGFATQSLSPGHPARADIDDAREAAERAAELTRQLLVFSRQDAPRLAELDLARLLRETEPLLRRAITEDIDLVSRVDEPPWPVVADAGQVQQGLLNLVVNAGDAMPDGGRVEIRVENVELDDPGPELHPGRYVRLTVADDGRGMPEDVSARAFEPFFTTKSAPAATGLGLATVYGTIKQLGGHVAVRSAPGAGSAFELYFPVDRVPARS